jgi:hypothetical protein
VRAEPEKIQPHLLFHHFAPHDTMAPSCARGSMVIERSRIPR